jgi:hypothetical protein
VRRLQKCAVGVLIVAMLSVTMPAFAACPGDSPNNSSLLNKLKTWIVRVFDYNGVSLPPG